MLSCVPNLKELQYSSSPDQPQQIAHFPAEFVSMLVDYTPSLESLFLDLPQQAQKCRVSLKMLQVNSFIYPLAPSGGFVHSDSSVKFTEMFGFHPQESESFQGRYRSHTNFLEQQ